MRPSSVARKTDGSQGPHAKTKASPLDAGAVGEEQRRHRTRRRHNGDPPAEILGPRLHEFRDQRAHGTPRHQHTALRLDQRHRDVAGVEVRVARAKARRVEHLQRIAALLERLSGRDEVGVVCRRQQKDTARDARAMPVDALVQRSPLDRASGARTRNRSRRLRTRSAGSASDRPSWREDWPGRTASISVTRAPAARR